MRGIKGQISFLMIFLFFNQVIINFSVHCLRWTQLRLAGCWLDTRLCLLWNKTKQSLFSRSSSTYEGQVIGSAFLPLKKKIENGIKHGKHTFADRNSWSRRPLREGRQTQWALVMDLLTSWHSLHSAAQRPEMQKQTEPGLLGGETALKTQGSWDGHTVWAAPWEAETLVTCREPSWVLSWALVSMQSEKPTRSLKKTLGIFRLKTSQCSHRPGKVALHRKNGEASYYTGHE